VRAVAFSPGGELIASAGDDGGVQIWSAATGELVRRCEISPESVESITFDPAGALLATATADGSVYVWTVLPAVRRC